jgi:hypothetical protein
VPVEKINIHKKVLSRMNNSKKPSREFPTQSETLVNQLHGQSSREAAALPLDIGQLSFPTDPVDDAYNAFV